MEEVLHANIFFFITGIAVIIFTALFCVALFHGIKALQSLRRILDRVESETEVIMEDVQQVRAYFAQDGLLRRLANKLFGSSKSESAHDAKKTTKRKSELKIKDHE